LLEIGRREQKGAHFQVLLREDNLTKKTLKTVIYRGNELTCRGRGGIMKTYILRGSALARKAGLLDAIIQEIRRAVDCI